MSAIGLVLLAASTFSFSGGDESALAAALSRHIERPVAVLCSGGSAILKKHEIVYEDHAALRRLLNLKVGADVGLSSWGMGPRAWPEGFFFKQRTDEYVNKVPRSSKTLIQLTNGKLSVQMESGGLTLEELRSGMPKVNLVWNKFFNESHFALAAHAADVSTVLRTVSDAIGAKLVIKDDSYTLDIDPVVFRRRTMALCDLPVNGSIPQLVAGTRGDRAYLGTLVKYLSDAQIVKFYAGWNGVVSFAPNHPVHKAALRRAEALIYANTPSEEVRVSGANVPKLIRSIDTDEPVRTSLREDGTILCLYPLTNGQWLGI